MGSCFQLSCHTDTDPRGPLPGSGGTAQVLWPGQVLVSPPAWCGTGRALPGQQCPAALGQATSPGSSRRSPPAPAPGCPPQSAAPAIDSVILSQAAGKLSLDPRGQGRLKAMGEAKLGAQPTRDPMDSLSTARSALQNPHTPKLERTARTWGCFAFPGVEAFSKLCLVQIGSLIFQSRVYQECHKCCCRQQQAVSGRDQCVVPARNVSPQDSFALSF